MLWSKGGVLDVSRETGHCLTQRGIVLGQRQGLGHDPEENYEEPYSIHRLGPESKRVW